jgi:hypothetical protein
LESGDGGITSFILDYHDFVSSKEEIRKMENWRVGKAKMNH